MRFVPNALVRFFKSTYDKYTRTDFVVDGGGSDVVGDVRMYLCMYADPDKMLPWLLVNRYAPGDPTEWTADTPDIALLDCTGVWVLSSYPRGDTFTDTEYYEVRYA